MPAPRFRVNLTNVKMTDISPPRSDPGNACLSFPRAVSAGVRRTEIEVELSTAVSAGAVVLIHQRWRIRSGEQTTARLEQIADATMVLRRIEGIWKLSIAAPWGYQQAYG